MFKHLFPSSALFLLLSVAIPHAADFSPTPLTISVQPQTEYKFDGLPLEIPFTLSGKSGAIWLVINTHGQAENIIGVQNGHLGWHYVNKIDTTIYISDKFEREPGENSITWDGRDENGNKAEPGSYDYYLWGYDNRSSDELACNFLRTGFGLYEQNTQICEKDNEGLPLVRPRLQGNIWRGDHYNNEYDEKYRQGTHFKWTIGSDPMDKSLIQTSICSIYFPELPSGFEMEDGMYPNPDYITYGGAAFDPKDNDIFYHPSHKMIPIEGEKGIYYAEYYTVLKWSFVPGGVAILDTDWFGFEKEAWESPDGNFRDTCIATDNYIYIADGSAEDYYPHNKIKCIDYNGELIFNKEFNEWFMPNRLGVVFSSNSTIDKMYLRNSDRLFMISTFSCMHQMINPQRLYDDPDDETDMVVFTNSNGDYFMDNGWQTDSRYPWYCVSSPYGIEHDVYVQNQIRTSLSVDSNNFNLIFVRNYGIASFGLSTQDGTGIGYMSFNDDNLDRSCIGSQICDKGSLYDGIYFSRGPYDTWGNMIEKTQTYYLAFDSAHGLITNNSAVETQNPLQFRVFQNTPNPFNPSTTISFSIPEKSHVSVEIYNITGQKIKTLVNGTMNAGEHSVKWDAGGCSAGVYFYKVKAGKYEKTMRMTLVR